MTLQVARIAATRLYKYPRPLRLSYAGQVLRVKGSQLRPERQFGQVGAELIGDNSVASDAEVILMAVYALGAVGIQNISVDLCMPTLVPAVCHGKKVTEQQSQRLRQALDRKDIAAVHELSSELGKTTTTILARLLSAVGTADEALVILKKLKLPKSAMSELSRLAATVKAIRKQAPDLTLTIDPVENRGFEYHTGVTFTLFSMSARGELGSGGRYQAGNNQSRSEAATGLTLFMDTVLRAAPQRAEPKRIFLPFGTTIKMADDLRTAGWVTIAEFKRSPKPESEAEKFKCTHILNKDTPVQLSKKKTIRKPGAKNASKRKHKSTRSQ
jgi:ATP phosphoribosyltransferase regulatory subunit